MRRIAFVFLFFFATMCSAFAWSNPTNWYWLVQDSSPGTQVFQSSSGTFVPLANADYTAFLAANNFPTQIDTAVNLFQSVINPYNVNQIGNVQAPLWAVQSVVPSATVTLTNPLVTTTIVTAPGTSGTMTLILPPMSLFGSWPIGFPLYIVNNSDDGSGHRWSINVRANDGTTPVIALLPGETGFILVTGNSTTNGSFSSRGLPGVPVLANAGGTGRSGLTANAVIIGEGNNAPVNFATVGTAGRYLRDNGAGVDPSFSAIPGSDLPNPSATTLGGIESITCAASKWINQISTSGVPGCTQPAFSDVSGSLTAAQLPENPLAISHGGTGVTAGPIPTLLAGMSSISNTLANDVALNNTGTFFTGPSIAQGTSGTWLVIGFVNFTDTSTGAVFVVKLTDGTTDYALVATNINGASVDGVVTLAAIVTAPAGNLRMQIKDVSSTNGVLFGATPGGATTKIVAIRIG